MGCKAQDAGVLRRLCQSQLRAPGSVSQDSGLGVQTLLLPTRSHSAPFAGAGAVISRECKHGEKKGDTPRWATGGSEADTDCDAPGGSAGTPPAPRCECWPLRPAWLHRARHSRPALLSVVLLLKKLKNERRVIFGIVNPSSTPCSYDTGTQNAYLV